VKYDMNRNINEMINSFAKKTNADLLCLIRRKRGLLHELLNPSVTKKEMISSEVPLLILHD